MQTEGIEAALQQLINAVGKNTQLKTKKFRIGKGEPLQAVILYIDGLVNKDIIYRDVLNPLMLQVDEDLVLKENVAEYLSERYIAVGETSVANDIEKASYELKSGKTIIILDKSKDFIVIGTTGGLNRNISEPLNETSLRGSRESFIENLEANISMLERIIKDKGLSIDRMIIGKRSQTDLALIYIDDIVDKDLLDSIKKKIETINVDVISGMGEIEQFIESSTYTIFPQVVYTERPDRVAAKIIEGRIAVLLNGTPFAMTAPALLYEFFHTVEDYLERTVLANTIRLLRLIALFTVLTLPSIYLTLVKFNAELIPIDFVIPIMQSRTGIPLTPFIEIMLVQLLIEFLREGGLRLPSKIAQTISIVGGIIIGDAAVKAQVVSPTTLLIIGITTVASFVIPNSEMSFTVRLLGFPMLMLSNIMGIFGISTGLILILLHILSLKSFGVPYFTFYKNDSKDFLVRAPLWQMNNRPEGIPNKNPIRAKKSRKKQN